MNSIAIPILLSLSFILNPLSAPSIHAANAFQGNRQAVSCPPTNMNVLESKGAMLMDGENMRILLIPVERDGVKIVSLIIVRKQERDYLELSRSLLPESGQEITLTVLGRDGSMLIVLVRNCGSQYYFMSYESKSIARDNRA